jgi:hypothetical protein
VGEVDFNSGYRQFGMALHASPKKAEKAMLLPNRVGIPPSTARHERRLQECKLIAVDAVFSL